MRVSKGITTLNEHGVYKRSDMKNIPISILSTGLEILKKIWLMANGSDFEGFTLDPVHPKSWTWESFNAKYKKSIYSEKVFLKCQLNCLDVYENQAMNQRYFQLVCKSSWIQKKITRAPNI